MEILRQDYVRKNRPHLYSQVCDVFFYEPYWNESHDDEIYLWIREDGDVEDFWIEGMTKPDWIKLNEEKVLLADKMLDNV